MKTTSLQNTDFGNHRKFTLKCLGAGITLVSVKLKNTVRTSNSYEIIRTAETQLKNKCVRIINNNFELSSLQRDTCINKLARVLDEITFKQYHVFKTVQEW